MSAIATRREVSYPLRTFRLITLEKFSLYLTPLLILLSVIIITILIGVVVGIAVGFPLPPDVVEGMKSSNLGIFWALPGLFISSSVLSVTRTFPTVLALGGTRRDFWVGTSLGFLVTSAATGLFAVILMWIEQLTEGWFVGVYALNINILGDGDVLLTFATIFLFALMGLYMGAACGTIYKAFGAMRLTIIIVATVIIAIGLLALAVWQWDTTLQIARATRGWLLPIALLGVTAISALASYFVIKRAPA